MLTQRYDIGEMVGEGSFGSVYVGVSKETGEKRALKLLKETYTFEEIINLREIQSIQVAGYHPFIVELFEVHRVKYSSAAVFVFEFMPDGSLHSFLYHRFTNKLGPPQDDFIRRTIHQVLQALGHLHSRGWMHRDVKPDNLLLKGDTCKLADFSLARPCNHGHVDVGGGGPMTQSVATLWYRAPEIVLLAHDYSSPADIFGLGCVAAEMFRLKPLFPSRNDADMLWRLLKMMGYPIASGWQQGQRLLDKRGAYLDVNTTDFSGEDFRTNLVEWLGGSTKRNPGLLLDLLVGMMNMNPRRRLTANQALRNSYFQGGTGGKLPKSSFTIPQEADPNTGNDGLDFAARAVSTSSRTKQVDEHRVTDSEKPEQVADARRNHSHTFVLKRCK